MAMIYDERNEADKAIEYLDKALAIQRRNGEYRGAAIRSPTAHREAETAKAHRG